MSVLGAGVYQFLRRRGLSYLWAGTIAGALVFCFGVLSGMELSAARAVVMYAVMLAGNVLGMAYDSVTALAFSALLQLWDNPLCLWYAGFVLSYGAVLAMVVAVFGNTEWKPIKHSVALSIGDMGSVSPQELRKIRKNGKL